MSGIVTALANLVSAWISKPSEGSKKTLLRFASFILLSAPVVITVLAPEQGSSIWINLDSVPEWFLDIYLTMINVIWGM